MTDMNKAAMVLRDLARHGLRADLMPTMDCSDVSTLYTAFAQYLRRLDDSLRDQALDALPAAVDMADRIAKAEMHAREMERQRNAYGEALTRIANGQRGADAARQAMADLTADVAPDDTSRPPYRSGDER